MRVTKISSALVVAIAWLMMMQAQASLAEQAVDKTPELASRLLTAYKNKGSDYRPRTEHLLADGSPKYTNRLILEESPYLIQHAHNPVNWYPWGKAAFAKAKKENKPIFLSIGYSTCHWCHVMERESFDNEAIADYINQHFVAIKVDRERRPDVDKTYMTALTIVKGSGGWPMSSILTPEGKPFFSGTYFPPELFMQVLQRATELWGSEEAQLRQIAEKITMAVQNRQRGLKLAEHIGKEPVQIAVQNILSQFDELQGGFSQAPKFPNEPYLFLLLDNVIREQDKDALEALKLTMTMMAQGGIYDQVGGGFHRYAVDNEWLVPHFEKMLYNQAHLVRAYLQIFMITGEQMYEWIIRQTLDYVLREMRADNGGFYSASDADSEGEEGKYFLWTVEELKKLLTPEQAQLAIALYGVTSEGNFSEQPMTANSGTNIFYLPEAIPDFARSHRLSLNRLYQDIDDIRNRLYQQRQQRIAPAIDKKIVTAWNGMMITALAQAGKPLQKPQYLDAAIKAAEYLWHTHHYTDKDRSGLWRSSLDGRPSVSAVQADYAYLAQGFLALYDATREQKWLQRSRQLTQEMIRLFWDKEEGGFYMSAPEQEAPLFERPKDIYDGAIPAGNAVALEVLSQLYYRTGDEYYHVKAMAMIASLSALIKNSPASFAYLLMAVNQLNFGELAFASTGALQYGGKGKVRIEYDVVSHKLLAQERLQTEVALQIQIAEGWHINSRYPLDKDLVATAVSLDKKQVRGWQISRVEYPEGEKLKLKFNDEPLSLYQGTINIKVILESKSPSSLSPQDAANQQGVTIPLNIRYQSCSDKICLPPQTSTFHFIPQRAPDLIAEEKAGKSLPFKPREANNES